MLSFLQRTRQKNLMPRSVKIQFSHSPPIESIFAADNENRTIVDDLSFHNNL